MGCRGLTCLWLVAVVQLVALMAVSVMQQLGMTELSHSDIELRILLVNVVKDESDYRPSESILQAIYEDTLNDNSDTPNDKHGIQRNKRQVGYDAILSDILRAQENIIAVHCANATKKCAEGTKGDIGLTGAAGDPGQKGEPGPVGGKGSEGPTGAKGQPGAIGSQGPAGSKGDTGPTGPQGPKGDTGALGEKGNSGPEGVPGNQGNPGVKGQPGDSPTQELPGPKGDPGTPGAKGEPGSPGVTGVKGQQGSPGDAGQQLEEGCECLKAPHISTDIPLVISARLGDPVEVPCEADGSPPPTVTWTDHVSNVLLIDHLFLGDFKNYTCTATNGYGTDTRTFTLERIQ